MKKARKIKWAAILSTAFLLLTAITRGPALKAASASNSETQRLFRETFDVVWNTVKEKHFDPNFGGVDWNQVRVKYSPLVDQAKTESELYSVLQRMLGELKQSHFSIVPAEASADTGAPHGPVGETGVEVKYLRDEPVIIRVSKGSGAEKADLRPGFTIKQVGGKPVQLLTKPLNESDIPVSFRPLLKARIVERQLSGMAGTSVRLQYVNGGGVLKEAVVAREVVTGEMSPAFGNFPPQRTEFEARYVTGGYGYIHFNVFVVSLMDRIRESIRSFAKAPGIIIDLRGNPGGLGGMAPGIAGLVSDKPSSLGRMQMRTGYMNFAVFPQTNPYTGPIAILIDGTSASTSEVFASGMQEIGRAVIVGERSAGAALPSVFTKLPTGAVFQYAIADFRSPRGKLIEGTGVTPDIEVTLDKDSLLAGRDVQLEAAIESFKSRIERKTQ